MNKVFEVSTKNVLILKNKVFLLYKVQERKIPYASSYIIEKGTESIVMNIYEKEASGKRKVMVQGKNEALADEISKLLVDDSVSKSISDYDYNQTRIGIDESGKGDFFGPLVIGGVLVDEKDIKYLEELGVRDSKKLSDKKIIELFLKFSKKITCEKVVISPEKYNQLYSSFKNINKLLAWGHSRVAENLLNISDKECSLIIIDKFAKHDSRVGDAMLEKSNKCRIIQVHKGERDVAVASASIVARAIFITEMEKLRNKFGMKFAFGVSDLVKHQRMEFIEKYGGIELGKIAKLHFKLK
ncbi:MAG TPA: ribonuclease HIII [Candidatus Dojkabacteria bacterium]|nr:ribonuclease HIII [Candidatus Dojkabacteria bacterium]